MKLKTALAIMTVVIVSVLAGCKSGAGIKESSIKNKELLTVDWQDGRRLEYKFVSGREIILDWDPTGKLSKSDKSTPDKTTESMEMVVAYTPIKIDPYGLSTIEATCKSVKVTRSKGPRKDAVEHLAGKTFTFSVGPTGKIEDYSQLDELIKEAGKKAFLPDTGRSRIKELDMIGDFVATQWFLWDSVSSLKNPSEGVAVGQSWNSKLSVPSPMVMRKARDVTYRLDEIRQSEKGRLAVISSSYEVADSAPQSWPIPYSGRFQMKGTFGFLSGYKVKLLYLQDQGDDFAGSDFVSIGGGYTHSLGLKSDGSLETWALSDADRDNIPAGNNFEMVAGGYYHNLALKSDGSLVAWGQNDWGACKVPTRNFLEVLFGVRFVGVAAGGYHSLALKSDGSLVAWGRNDWGSCNVPTRNFLEVLFGVRFVGIAAGGYHSLALKSDGSLVACGRNDDGQCDVPEDKDFVAIAAGEYHSLALKSNGSLVAWGRNDYDQCNTPPGNFIGISTGLNHSLALKSDGSLVAWGRNSEGQCDVPAGKDFVSIAGGRYHSIALKSDGSLLMWGAWGYDFYGRGEELFNIEAGRTEQYNQKYQMQLQASIPMGISVKPMITIKQNLTMELK